MGSKNSRPNILDPQEFFVRSRVIGAIRKELSHNFCDIGISPADVAILFRNTNSVKEIQKGLENVRELYPQLEQINCVIQNCGLGSGSFPEVWRKVI